MSPLPSPPLRLPVRRRESHKGDYGRVLLVGGSRGMGGAIALTSMAALRTGSGLVSAVVPDRCLETVAGFDPCLMTMAAADTDRGEFAPAAAEAIRAHIEKFDALGVGPGMGTGAGSVAVVRAVAGCSNLPRVFDADALNILASDELASLDGPAVLTPHPGELQRLTGAPASDRSNQVDAAVALARRLGVIVLLKGPETLVTDGQTRWLNPTGNPGMATGGTGDCLTGIITSLLGQRLDPFAAARLGAYVHGLAGDLAAEELGQAGMTARDLLAHVPAAVRRVVTVG